MPLPIERSQAHEAITTAPGGNAASTRVITVRSAYALATWRDRWERLAHDALEPNVYFEPWMLLPLLEILPDARSLEIVLVTRKDGLLIGLFPFVRETKYRGLPLPTLTSWSHDYCFLATPLIEKAHGRECLNALFDWADSSADAALLQFSGIAGDGPFQHLLTDVLDDRDATPWTAMRRTRGLYTLRADADAYLTRVLDGEGRRRLRSKERKLSDLGRLDYAEFAAAEGDIAEWMAEFLALEAAGWKGREGSAMASDSPRRQYFETVIRAAAERGQLDMLALRLDDRAIAIKCNLRSGEGAFVFKIAYDEQYGKYSPGMLLEIENIRRLHARRDIRWMDSCANPRSRLFGEACIERRTIETVLIAARGHIAPLVVAAMPLAQWAIRRVRALRSRNDPHEQTAS